MAHPGTFDFKLISIIQEPSLMEFLSPHSIFQLGTGIALMIICAVMLINCHGRSAVCFGGVMLGGTMVDLATDSEWLLHQHILALVAYTCASAAYLFVRKEDASHRLAVVFGIAVLIVYSLMFDYFSH